MQSTFPAESESEHNTLSPQDAECLAAGRALIAALIAMPEGTPGKSARAIVAALQAVAVVRAEHDPDPEAWLASWGG